MGMPRTDAQRVAKYNAKTAPTTTGLKIAGRLTRMKSDFATAVQALADMQLLVRAELSTDPTIFPLQYGGYYAYSAELWKLQITTLQPAVDAVAQTIADKWISRGLDCGMLLLIAANVFNITIVCPSP